MTTTNFSAGTVVTSDWLNDVDATVYGLPDTTDIAQGDALIGVKLDATGSVARTQHAKNADLKSITDFTGVDPTGATDSSAGITAALAAESHLWVPDGIYLLNSTIELASFKTLDFAGNAWFYAGTDGMTMLKATTAAYASKLINPNFNGNSKTGVTAMDMNNFRVGSELISPIFQDLEIGLILRNGCFGLRVSNPASMDVHYPIQILANASNCVIDNPVLDNEPAVGGDGTGIGIDIRAGAGSNLGVRVYGGYTQGFDIGIKDAGTGTNIVDTYFEDNSTADIYGDGARGSCYNATQHFGPDGPACFKLRNCDAVSIRLYIMASGARVVVYDVNNTNTNCNYDETNSNAYYNIGTDPTADTISKAFMNKVCLQVGSTFTPVLIGSTSAGVGTYTLQSGMLTVIGDTVLFNINLEWSGHTGTGNIVINGLPNTVVPVSFTPRRIFTLGMDGIPYTGPAIFAYFNGTSGIGSGVQIVLAQVAVAGTASLIPITSTGKIFISGSYRFTE